MRCETLRFARRNEGLVRPVFEPRPGESKMAPQAVEIARNGLGNGAVPARALAGPPPGGEAAYGFSHAPLFAERKRASMTPMLATASSIPNSSGEPSRTAREKASPCSVY